MYFSDYSAKMCIFSLLCIVNCKYVMSQIHVGITCQCKYCYYWSGNLLFLRFIEICTDTTKKPYKALSFILSVSMVCSIESLSQPVSQSIWSVRVTLKSCYIFLLFLLFSLKTDHDECSGSNPVCDDNASCQNNHGSYDCFCKVGFTGDGKTCDGKMIAII